MSAARPLADTRPGGDAAAVPAASTELAVFDCPLDGVRLIEASAGTGKTWAISALVLRLLLERGLPVQQVLVVTFTEAATAELRERIRGRLADVLAALAGPEASSDPFVAGLLARLRSLPDHDEQRLRQRVELALHGYDEAAIHTIHGYGQRALADAPFSAGLPMTSEVLQDDTPLRDEAVKQAWRAEVSGAPIGSALAAALLQRPDTPQSWSASLRQLLARPLAQRRWGDGGAAAGEAAAEALATALCAAHAALAADWAAQRQAIVELLLQALPALHGNVYKASSVEAAAEAWERWLGGPALASVEREERALRLFTPGTLALRTKKGQRTPEHPFFAAAEALLDQRVALACAQAGCRAALLRRVLERAEHALREHKRRHGLVAFDDMLYNLHARLLPDADGGDGSAEALATQLRVRYPAALIDEFQDTDPLQLAVFRRLYVEPAGGGEGALTLFLVGDPKQAIYSFRNADLPTYLQARDLAVARYSLAANQRSSPALIEALNRLFTRHPAAFMQPGLDYQPVRAGDKPRTPFVDHTAGAPARHAALQLWGLPRDDAGAPLPRAEAHRLALHATAAEIARLLAEAAAGRLRLGERALRAGDVAVLVRSHRQGAEVRQALEARGVRSVELSQASVFHAVDADDLACVLEAVLQPTRERLLRRALATELFGRDALALAAAGGLDADTDDPAEPDAGDGLAAEMLRFTGYRTLWEQRGVGVMLRRMLVDERLAQRLLAHPQGERRLTNLLHLAEILHQAEADQHTPAALLRWFNARRADDTVTEESQQRLESDQHLVQIVTIHKSKGLEYPVVFCPFLWAPRGAAAPWPEPVAWQDDDGMVLDFRPGTEPGFDRTPLQQRIAAAEAAETLRLIYVALTRAVHRCHLVVGGCTTRRGSVTAAGLQSLLNWLVAGGGIDPQAWLTTRGPGLVSADAVDEAWRALADGLPAGGAADDPLPVSWQPLAEVGRDAPAVRPPDPQDAVPLADRLPPPRREAAWSIGSYSQLARATPGSVQRDQPVEPPDTAVVDHDGVPAPGALDPPDDAKPEAPFPPLPARRRRPVDERQLGLFDSGPAGDPPAATAMADDDVLRFPRGPSAGDCIHHVFEHADFTRPAGWPEVIERALDALPQAGTTPRPALAAMLRRMLHDVCATPIAPGLVLGELPSTRRLNELPFHLPVPSLSDAALQHWLAARGFAVPPLGFGRLQGYLRGVIDLVFETADGRVGLIDWKSNWLGSGPADHGPAACEAAMAEHGYHLQALIYALALHRLLRLRRPGYRPERDFAGVGYLFVRGVRPDWRGPDGAPCGVVWQRHDPALLDDLDRLFGGADA